MENSLIKFYREIIKPIVTYFQFLGINWSCHIFIPGFPQNSMPKMEQKLTTIVLFGQRLFFTEKLAEKNITKIEKDHKNFLNILLKLESTYKTKLELTEQI